MWTDRTHDARAIAGDRIKNRDSCERPYCSKNRSITVFIKTVMMLLHQTTNVFVCSIARYDIHQLVWSPESNAWLSRDNWFGAELRQVQSRRITAVRPQTAVFHTTSTVRERVCVQSRRQSKSIVFPARHPCRRQDADRRRKSVEKDEAVARVPSRRTRRIRERQQPNVIAVGTIDSRGTCSGRQRLTEFGTPVWRCCLASPDSRSFRQPARRRTPRTAEADCWGGDEAQDGDGSGCSSCNGCDIGSGSSLWRRCRCGLGTGTGRRHCHSLDVVGPVVSRFSRGTCLQFVSDVRGRRVTRSASAQTWNGRRPEPCNAPARRRRQP